MRTHVVMVATATFCIGALSLAHHMPGSISTVKRSASGETIEIIHRLHTHDAELGIAATLGKRSTSLETLVDRAQLALYVEKRFHIAEYSDGKIGKKLDDLRPGDILSFSTRGGPVTHVGLYVGGGQFIHSASRGVQLSRLSADDPYGRWWYKRRVGVRRILE